MAEWSKIAWTTHSFNPWVGCTKVSPACHNCYAEQWAKRSGMVQWGGPRRRTSAANWKKPLKWNAAVRDGDARPRVFCASLADVWDNDVPDEWREDLFRLIAATPQLDWLLLSKRIGNATRMLPSDWNAGYRNVWLGATAVNQQEADRDIQKLLDVPAAVRFLSMEPLLGSVDLRPWLHELDWVIVGGESGAHARPLEVEWVKDLRKQCETAGTAFFMKQGSQANWSLFKEFDRFPSDIRIREFPVTSTPAGTSCQSELRS